LSSNENITEIYLKFERNYKILLRNQNMANVFTTIALLIFCFFFLQIMEEKDECFPCFFTLFL